MSKSRVHCGRELALPICICKLKIRCRERALQPLLLRFYLYILVACILETQNMSDEEDDTWGEWTALGKSQQAPLQTSTTCLRRAESDSQERSYRIARRMRILLNSGYKCVSQARCQARRMIDNPNHKWLQKSELDKIKAECKDKCCNPCTNELHCHESQQFVDRVNTTISEAATEHSEIRRLLNISNYNPESGKAATKHSERPKKLGKGKGIPNVQRIRKRADSESSDTDDDYETWLQSHGYST